MIPRPPAFLNHHQGSSSPCLLLCLNLHLSFWIALDQGRLSSAQPAPSSLVIPAHDALITQPPLSRSLLRLFPRFSFTFHKTHMTCLVSFSLWAFLLHFLFISSYSSGSLASVLQVSRDTPVRTWSPPVQNNMGILIFFSYTHTPSLSGLEPAFGPQLRPPVAHVSMFRPQDPHLNN